MPARAVVVWVGLVGLLAALTSSSAASPSVTQGAWLGLIVAGVVGLGARSSLVLSAVRAGRLLVADDGRPSRSPLFAGVVAMVAAGAALVLLGRVSGGVVAAVAVAVGGGVGVAVALLWPRGGTLRPSSTSLWAFLLGGAAQAALMAAAMGAVVAVGRFGVVGDVPPGAFSRVLAGTFLCDALLGVGGFVRADVALRQGLVRVAPRPVPDAPGPVLLALVLAAPTVLLLPSLAPPVAATTAIIVKVVAGAIVGGLLHLVGGLRGSRRALS